MEPTPVNAEGAPRPVGPYSHAVVAGSTVFVSGQIGLDPATGLLSGDTAADQLRQAMCNLRAVLVSMGLDMRALCKTTIYLTSIDEFAECNAVYEEALDGWRPARAVVEVRRLPKDARVEIEGIACR